nr:MAG: replication initiation protein [Microvirus Sku15]
MSDYPFTKCLSPKVVVNSYNGETLAIPCGCCEVCNMSKAQSYKLKCTLESLCYLQTWFITLTYADNFLPQAVPCTTEDGQYILVDRDTGELLCDDFNPACLTPELFDKFQSDYIPYLLKSDLQLFIKRLRKYYDKKKCKLRYYAVGEYGPAHFRPHYHILLWFETEQNSEDLQKIISEKWLFGRVDVQKAEGDCSQYVAGYANSFSFVPEILRLRKFRPFSVHSQKLGEKNLSNEYASLYENEYSEVIRESYINNGNYSEFTLWRSYLSRYFPRCVSYARKSSYERFISYTIYRYAKKIGHISLSDLADTIANAFFTNCALADFICHNKVVYDYFGDLFFCTKDTLPYEDKEQFFRDKIYRELLISRRFCQLADTLPLCGYSDGVYFGQTSRDRALFNKIEKFYSKRELSTLRLFYENQENYFFTHDFDDKTFGMFYNPYVEVSEVLNTIEFKRFRSSSIEKYNKSIKHKLQNDLNKLLYG